MLGMKWRSSIHLEGAHIIQVKVSAVAPTFNPNYLGGSGSRVAQAVGWQIPGHLGQNNTKGWQCSSIAEGLCVQSQVLQKKEKKYILEFSLTRIMPAMPKYL